MNFPRLFTIGVVGATLLVTASAQTQSDIASLTAKAKSGNGLAQYRLGLAYANGNGVKADPVEAYIWLSMAYESNFRGKALANVAGNLSPELLALAREKLVERRAALSGQAAPVKTETAEAEIPVVRTQPTDSQLQKQLDDALNDKGQLSTELSQSWQESEALKKQLAEAQANSDLLAARAEKASTERDAAAKRLDELQDAFAALRAESELARTTAETRLAELSAKSAAPAAPVAPAYPDLRNKVSELEASLATLKNAPAAPSYPDLSGKVAQLETALAAAKSAAPAYPDLSAKVRELEADLVALHRETTAVQKEAKDLSDERLEREKQFVLLQQQTAQLNSAYTTLQTEATALRSAAALPAAPAYPDLREKVSELEGAVAALKNAPPAYPDLSSRVAELETALASTRNAAPAYPDLSAKVTELETTLANLKADDTAAKTEAARVAEESREQARQMAVFQQHAGELTNAHNALKQENEALRAIAAQAKAPAYPDLREKVAELEGALAALKSAPPAYPDLSSRVAELETALAAAKNSTPAYPDLSLRVAELEGALSAARNAAPAWPDLSAKVAELESKLATAQTPVNTIQEVDSAEIEALRTAKAAAEQKVAESENARSELAKEYDEFKRSALNTQRQLLTAQSQVQILESEKAALRQQSNDDQTRLAEFSSQLAAARRQLADRYPTTPAYPDLRAKVEQLEGELTKSNEQSAGMINLLQRSQEEAKTASAQLEKLRSDQQGLETKLAAAQKNAKSKAPAYPDLRNKVTELEGALAAASNAAPAYPDLSGRVAELEKSLAAAQAAPAPAAAQAPAYPDLSSKVAELEAALTEAKNAKPAYPDLRTQVDDLEIRLAAAQALPAHMMPRTEYAKLKQEFDDSQEKLGTTLRGYASLERERDELVQKLAAASKTPAATVAQTAPVAPTPATVTPAASSQPSRPAAAAPTRPAASTAPVATVAGAPTRPAAQSAFAAAAEIRKHLVVAGDSLSKLSQRYYGTPGRWREIFEANREVIAPNGALKVGSELRIP